MDPVYELSAAVYTELSDVEAEINGLITYDRQVCATRNALQERWCPRGSRHLGARAVECRKLAGQDAVLCSGSFKAASVARYGRKLAFDDSRRGSCNRMRAAGDQDFALCAASCASRFAGPIAQPELALLQRQRNRRLLTACPKGPGGPACQPRPFLQLTESLKLSAGNFACGTFSAAHVTVHSSTLNFVV